MKLAGLQKLTLLDYPGTVACTVFTPGCNLRCPFCHNATLVIPGGECNRLSEDDFFHFLETRKGVLEGVAVTGGEPLLEKEIDLFLSKIKSMGFRVKLDTNGTNPQALISLVERGLVDRVAMDVKQCPSKYAQAVGIPGFDIAPVAATKDFLLSDHVSYEFRTTVVKGIHQREDLIALAEWIRGAGEYYLQEFKDSGNLIAPSGLSPFGEQEMKLFEEDIRHIVPSVKIRGV